MEREAFDWLKPSPLWDNGLLSARAPDFFQPQLLQFSDDDFMTTFRAAAAATDPTTLKTAVVKGTPDPAPKPKLFQAAHGRHYLVCAALTCRTPGFPQRVVRQADGESAFFVLRRFINNVEFGWVVDGANKSWVSLNGQPRQLLPKEQRLPLFTVAGADQRKFLVGYVPVSNRETYSVSGKDLFNLMDTAEQAKYPNGIDLRIEELQGRFSTPLMSAVWAPIDPNTGKGKTAMELVAAANAGAALRLSVYLLLDLWEYFNNEKYLPDVAAALRDDPGAGFTGEQAAAKTDLMTFLMNQPLGGGLSLGAALGAVAKQQQALNAPGDANLAQLGFTEAQYDLQPLIPAIATWARTLEQKVLAALPPDTSTVAIPAQTPSSTDTYALRCVYERPQCALPQRVVSGPSIRFQLAAHFDGDAPARPIRIMLPTDVSIAGLRKFKKGVSIMVSGSMQQKINMLTGHEKGILKDPADVGSDSNGLAFMCSFSIQIIFIVAFFLLLMFVIILNICFWWMAFFRICIPIPKKLLSG